MSLLIVALTLNFSNISYQIAFSLSKAKVSVDLIPVDNVLLSADGRDTFLCDFGLSETLDHNGQSTKAVRGEFYFLGNAFCYGSFLFCMHGVISY